MIKKITLISLWIVALSAALIWPKHALLTKSKAPELHIFSWGNNIDEATLTAFEERSGCRLRMHSYESNEEMLTKLKATGGSGYDLIIPSDYAVALLIKEGLVQPLDKEKLPFIDTLSPYLMGNEFDPDNTYSLPLQWEVLGFGVNKETFGEEPLSYRHVFENFGYNIVMVNDPVEAISLAAHHLFGHKRKLTKDERRQVKELLTAQKGHVEAYVESRADYLLSTRNCELAISPSSYIWRLEKERGDIRFALPEDHVFLEIESIAIPKNAEKIDLIYAFINHLYEKESLISQANTYYFMPPTDRVIDELEFSDKMHHLLKELSQRDDQTLKYFRHMMAEKEIRKLWIDVKS